MNWLHVITGGLFLVSAIHKLWGRQAEHFFTRFICFLWYVGTVRMSATSMDADYIILLVPLVEISSPLFRHYWKAKR